MTVQDCIRNIRSRLATKYGAGEALWMTRLIFNSLKGWSATDMIIHEGDNVSDYLIDKIRDILRRLDADEPIQYILGEAYFYGMNLRVDRSTLIPRPETEELVDMIVKTWGDRNDLSVLDIGTGSGAIAIALQRNLPFSKVSAIDISEEALKIAKENASDLHAKIDFIKKDIFEFSPKPQSFDIIVSNPPYIDESEKADMDKNVLDYEPHTALFVPDASPLIFYSRIADIASKALVDGGGLYFEINPRHSSELVALLEKDGLSDIEIHKDIHGKQRFISAFHNHNLE